MKINKQQGMILPVMMLFLTLLIIVTGRLFSLSEQHRHAVRELAVRSRQNSILFSVENLLLQKLPTVNISLLHRLQGKKNNEPLVIPVPYPSGKVNVVLSGAQRCLNLAPLMEDDKQQKEITRTLLKRLLKNVPHSDTQFMERIQQDPLHIVVPDEISKWVCNLPGAGQHWDMTQLTPAHFTLLAALLPNVSHSRIERLLAKGLTFTDKDMINRILGQELILSSGQYYWLELELPEGESYLHVRELIKIDESRTTLIRRRLLDDNAL